MAENWLSRVGHRVGQSVQNFGTRVRDHPFQTAGSALLSLIGGALGGPVAAQAASRGSQALFDRYNQSNAPAGLSGIISENAFDPGSPNNPQNNMSGYLGIPSYSSSGSLANSFLTGNFKPEPVNNAPLVDLNYGQNAQAILNDDGGLPGITGPNIFSGSRPSGPNFGYSGNTASGAQGTFGSGVRQTSMAQIENAIAAGQGQGLSNRVLLPNHEFNDELAEAKRLGMTRRQYRNQS